VIINISPDEFIIEDDILLHIYFLIFMVFQYTSIFLYS